MGKLVKDELQKQDGVELKDIDLTTLVDIQDVKINEELSQNDRVADFIKQIKNPYCYRHGDYIVRIKFSDSDVTLADRLKEIIDNMD